MEGKKSKRRILIRVYIRYLTGDRRVVLLDIDFDLENQDDIHRYINLIKNKTIDFNNIISKRFLISEINEAISFMQDGQSAGRVLIHF